MSVSITNQIRASNELAYGKINAMSSSEFDQKAATARTGDGWQIESAGLAEQPWLTRHEVELQEIKLPAANLPPATLGTATSITIEDDAGADSMYPSGIKLEARRGRVNGHNDLFKDPGSPSRLTETTWRNHPFRVMGDWVELPPGYEDPQDRARVEAMGLEFRDPKTDLEHKRINLLFAFGQRDQGENLTVPLGTAVAEALLDKLAALEDESDTVVDFLLHSEHPDDITIINARVVLRDLGVDGKGAQIDHSRFVEMVEQAPRIKAKTW